MPYQKYGCERGVLLLLEWYEKSRIMSMSWISMNKLGQFKSHDKIHNRFKENSKKIAMTFLSTGFS